MKKIQVLVPLAGGNAFFDAPEFQYPKPLVEIGGKPMIQLVVENLDGQSFAAEFIFVLKEHDSQKYHLDDTLRILTDGRGRIVKLKNDTRGAVCSALMAIELLDPQGPLLIANGDQIIDGGLIGDAVAYFTENGFDGGAITFESVHPKWSFVRTEGELVVETAEKRPLSRNAIAGLYFFARAADFVDGAFDTIRFDANQNGSYFTSSTLNQMILRSKKVGHFKVPNAAYHSFYSPAKINEYENRR